MPVQPRPPTLSEGFYARTFALLALFVLGFLTYRILLPLFGPLAWAAFIAFLLHPLHVRLTNLLRGRNNISSGLITAATVIIILGPLTGLAAAFASQVDDVLSIARRLAEQQMGQGATGDGRGIFDGLPAFIQSNVGISPSELRGWIEQVARTVLQSVAALGGRIFVGALGTAVNFTVTMFVLFFLLRDGARMLTTIRGLIPMPAADKRRLFAHLGAVTHALIYGTGLTALVQGALVGVGFAAVGLPAPVVFGVLAALLALLPLVGTPVVWVPAVIVLATQGRWVAAIALLVWGVVVSTVDNVLRPVLVSGRARIGALTVFIGVIGGVSAFGAVGLFLGPVVLSLVMALAEFTLEMRRLQREARRPATATTPADTALPPARPAKRLRYLGRKPRS